MSDHQWCNVSTWQSAAGLSHDPDRHPVHFLAPRSPQQQVILQRREVFSLQHMIKLSEELSKNGAHCALCVVCSSMVL